MARCDECGARPAWWHIPTNSYLCGGHLDQWRKRYHYELQFLRDKEAERIQRTRGLALIIGLCILGWASTFAFLFAARG